MNRTLILALAVSMLVMMAACSSTARKDKEYFSQWPQGSSPQEVGKHVAERFVAAAHPNFGRTTPPNDITYPETCTWYGALTFAKLSGDADLTARLVERFEPLFGPEADLVPAPRHVDATVFGSVPLELYIQTRQDRYLRMGQGSRINNGKIPRRKG